MDETNKIKKISHINFTEFEKQHRQIKNELLMKRTQVTHLQKNLDSSNLKIHELTRELSKSKAELDENQFNFSLLVRKCRNVEDKLQESREALEKSQLQQEMIVSERETLKNCINQLGIEKYNLKTRLDELETRHKYEMAFQNDLISGEAKIKTAMEGLHSIVEKCKSEHEILMKLTQQSQSSEQLHHANKYLVEENECLKKEKEAMDEKLLILTVKCQKFEELMMLNPEINATNLPTELIFKHWKKSVETYKETTTAKNEIIAELTKFLSQEREANKCLIFQNERLNDKIVELENELKEFLQTKTKEVTTEICKQVAVKSEIIEISE